MKNYEKLIVLSALASFVFLPMTVSANKTNLSTNVPERKIVKQGKITQLAGSRCTKWRVRCSTNWYCPKRHHHRGCFVCKRYHHKGYYKERRTCSYSSMNYYRSHGYRCYRHSKHHGKCYYKRTCHQYCIKRVYW